MKSWFRPLLLALSLIPLACSAQPLATAYVEGKQFVKVRQAIPPADAKKVTVEEFFWYGCSHCFSADPAIEAWKPKKAADVVFERIPNTLGRDDGEVHARALYIADALGVLDKTHGPMFEAIHIKRMPLATMAAVRSLYATVAGVKPEDFDRATSSFMVDSRMRRADSLAKTYFITSVPTIVVGGKYSTNLTMAGGPDKLMAVVDFLVEKIRKERK